MPEVYRECHIDPTHPRKVSRGGGFDGSTLVQDSAVRAEAQLLNNALVCKSCTCSMGRGWRWCGGIRDLLRSTKCLV
jgi:hypothetical protein